MANYSGFKQNIFCIYGELFKHSVYCAKQYRWAESVNIKVNDELIKFNDYVIPKNLPFADLTKMIKTFPRPVDMMFYIIINKSNNIIVEI